MVSIGAGVCHLLTCSRKRRTDQFDPKFTAHNLFSWSSHHGSMRIESVAYLGSEEL